MVDKTTAFSPVRDLVSIDKDSPQNINPIVTLFDNAIVSLTTSLDFREINKKYSGGVMARSQPKTWSLKLMETEIRQLLPNVHALAIRFSRVSFHQSYWDCS